MNAEPACALAATVDHAASHPRAFVLATTSLQPPTHVPELRFYLADAVFPLWEMTEEQLGAAGLPPPFWAFAWAGGQALARYLLDHPAEVQGRAVFDFACGSGLVAVASMKAGARSAIANDIDMFAVQAASLNAEANGVMIDVLHADVLGEAPPKVDLIVAGDVCYERPLAERLLRWLKLARSQGSRVLIGDPGRMYLPRAELVQLAEYRVITPRDLEDCDVKRACVWELQ